MMRALILVALIGALAFSSPAGVSAWGRGAIPAEQRSTSPPSTPGPLQPTGFPDPPGFEEFKEFNGTVARK